MPSERSHLLQHGEQCRLCLRSYQIGERVRRLRCRHKFHIDCIGNKTRNDRSIFFVFF
jgi:E3 ubiquitin-protein ligase ZSWIM2